MRRTLSPASTFSLIAVRYAAAVALECGPGPANTVAAVEADPASTLAAVARQRRS